MMGFVLFEKIINTCSKCGSGPFPVYAHNRDEAIAGSGLCAGCAGVGGDPVGQVRVKVDDLDAGCAGVDATDAAKVLADELGIDLAVVAVAYDLQRVIKPDVERFVKELDDEDQE